MENAQINVRLDRQLKLQGDAALIEMGLSPSQAVRKLWEIVAKRGKQAIVMRKLLTGADIAQDTEAEKTQDSPSTNPLLARGWNIADSLTNQLTNSNNVYIEQDYDTLYAEAMEEHYRDKGVIS